MNDAAAIRIAAWNMNSNAHTENAADRALGASEPALSARFTTIQTRAESASRPKMPCSARRRVYSVCALDHLNVRA